MRIGLNIIGLALGAWGGVETYFRNLLHYLQKVEYGNEYTLLIDDRNVAHFPLNNPSFTRQISHFARPSFPWFVRAALRRTLYTDILKPYLNRVPLDVIHHPFTVLNPRGLATPSVLTFWDMQQEFMPEFFSARELRRRQRTYRPSAEEATRIIVSSEFTKQCLVERYRIVSDKIDVIYTGYGPEYRIIDDSEGLDRVRKKYGLSRPFLYYPAASWPHKNHRTLLTAMRILCDQYDFDGQLVLTGIAMQAHGDMLWDIERLGLGERVKVLGYLPYEELPFLYNLARLMVFPSLFEGFGIPLVEAMACGCPVVCSRAASIPEVVGEAGVTFDPLSAEDMADKVNSVWQDGGRISDMKIRGLERARIFDWETTARKTVATYERAVRA
jgi:glycosyltransferase involved in cell wall biosynthesis